MTGLLYSATTCITLAVKFILAQDLRFAFDFVLQAGCLLLPVTGWVAET